MLLEFYPLDTTTEKYTSQHPIRRRWFNFSTTDSKCRHGPPGGVVWILLLLVPFGRLPPTVAHQQDRMKVWVSADCWQDTQLLSKWSVPQRRTVPQHEAAMLLLVDRISFICWSKPLWVCDMRRLWGAGGGGIWFGFKGFVDKKKLCKHSESANI